MASSSLEWHFCVKSHICLRKGRMGRLTVDWVVSHDSVESAETSKILLARYTDLPELPAAVPQDWKGRDWTLFSGKELLTMESDRLYHAFNQKSKTFEMRGILLCGNPSMMFRTATKDHLFFSRLSSIVFIRVWIPLLVGPCDCSRHLSTTTLFAHFLCYLLQWSLDLCQVSCQIPLVRSWTGEMPMVTWIGAPAPACGVTWLAQAGVWNAEEHQPPPELQSVSAITEWLKCVATLYSLASIHKSVLSM